MYVCMYVHIYTHTHTYVRVCKYLIALFVFSFRAFDGLVSAIMFSLMHVFLDFTRNQCNGSHVNGYLGNRKLFL